MYHNSVRKISRLRRIGHGLHLLTSQRLAFRDFGELKMILNSVRRLLLFVLYSIPMLAITLNNYFLIVIMA